MAEAGVGFRRVAAVRRGASVGEGTQLCLTATAAQVNGVEGGNGKQRFRFALYSAAQLFSL